MASFPAPTSHGRCVSEVPSHGRRFSPMRKRATLEEPRGHRLVTPSLALGCSWVHMWWGPTIMCCGCSSQDSFGGDLQPWKKRRDTFMYRSVCFAPLHTVLAKACRAIGKAKHSSNPLGWILASQGRVCAERWHCLNLSQCNSGGITEGGCDSHGVEGNSLHTSGMGLLICSVLFTITYSWT